uniref:Predicted protein n=1 Tax=Hordeum vulgare subsp. vulgare TaxID=112509 RepID=F2DFW4_HORVV|nr:predicted protein [Hordeum vulgare subsp. vulgare]
MLSSLYNFKLIQPIQDRIVSLAKCDGNNPNLVCATLGGKLFVHTPHQEKEQVEQGGQQEDIKFLNLNKEVTAITQGSLLETSKKEILMIGSKNTLVAYDVEKNSDIFYKDIPDGVNAMVFGYIRNNPKPLVIVGGNCSIQGFDQHGNEKFWTVTGDNVSAMCFCDIDGDSFDELLVGSEDFAIRAFKQEEIFVEITESGKVIDLVNLKTGSFAYALDNGTVGIYRGDKRQWRSKTKMKFNSMVGYNSEGGANSCLIVAWSNGRIEVRSDTTGEVLFKMSLGSDIVRLLKGDYRMDNSTQIIVVCSDGYVRGYSFNYDLRGLGADGDQTKQQAKQSELIFQELLKKKNELVLEYTTLVEGQKGKKKTTGTESTLVPKNAKLSSLFRHNPQKKYPELYFHTNANSGAIIRSVVVFAEQIFPGESSLVSPAEPTSFLHFPLILEKNVSITLNIKALVGTSGNSMQYQVFEFQKKLPRFANFFMVKDLPSVGIQVPKSSVTFVLRERIPRFVKWLDSSFIIDESKVDELEKQEALKLAFVNLREGKPLQIEVSQDTGRVKLFTDNMETAGDMIQDLCLFMDIQTDITSVAEFPLEMENLKEVLSKINNYNEIRMRLTADMADSIKNAKTFVVKAEDARILSQMGTMKKMYSNLFVENRNLITELMKRNNNHEALLAELKKVNNYINKAANLRYGTPKKDIVTLCRAAIKANNVFALVQIIQTGKE